MGPTTEQLIRDYLNRLSVASRGRLSAEDRRALVTRTHDFIERNASESGPPTAMEVAALLSRLGDPGALVEQEVARLAEADGAAAAPADGERTGRKHGLLRRRNTPVSWHWPAAPGSPDVRRELLTDASARPVANGAAQDGQTGQLVLRVARQPRSPDPEASGSEDPAQPRPGAAGDGQPAAADRPWWPFGEPPSGGPQPDAAEETAAAALTEPTAGPGPADAVRVWRARLADIASRALAGCRRTPMEATAAILLGLGGVIYPPVWLLGACLAMASKVWDYRDKWAGLAGPVAVMIIGTAACLALGTSRSGFGPYLHEAWVYLNIWSRVGAVAGTWYLVWRLAHERPAPDVPPWSRPRRVD
jgi:hypothetical protein